MSSIFPIPRVYRQHLSGVERPPAGRGRRVWLLSRALCRYRVFSRLDDPSPTRRLAALDLRITEWSPYAATASLVQEEGKRVGVWIWDRSVVEAAILAAGEQPDRVTVAPETAMQPRLVDGGLRHVKTLDGSEAQWWGDGLMLASRWWPKPPSESDWRQFCRAASIRPDAVAAVFSHVETLELLPALWVTPSSGRGIVARINWRRTYEGVAAAAIVLFGVFAGQSLRDHLDLRHLQRDIAEAEAAAQPRAMERAQARNGLSDIDNLRTLDALPGQLDLFARISAVMPQNGAQLTDWNFQHGDLDFTVTSATPIDAVANVRTLEAVAGFRNVSLVRSNGDRALKIKLKVAPR
jgi:hypothetical protein